MADIDISQLSALELKALRDNIETQLVDREALELDKLSKAAAHPPTTARSA